MTLSDTAAHSALANAIARIRHEDVIVFRLGTLDDVAGDGAEITGTGVARLSTAQTLLVWVPLSQKEAARQISQLELSEREHVAMYRALPAFRPALHYFSHGTRWTWFPHDV